MPLPKPKPVLLANPARLTGTYWRQTGLALLLHIAQDQ